MDEPVNPLEKDHSLSVVLPGGVEKNTTVHGSKPVMDLLVTLCASYHLNPSDYTVEVLSPNKNNISFKPNSPIGSLEAGTIVLKPKGMEEKTRKPYMPEASVRLLINYNKSHKAVVRVNPRVPLEMLLPAVCDKCEFQVETTILLRDSQSEEPLDLSKTLNEHGLREVFAADTAAKEPGGQQHQPRTPEAAVTPTEVVSPLPLQDLPKKAKKQKENAGFLSLFRRRKKKPEMAGAGSAPASPGLKVGVGMNAQGVSSSDTLPGDMPKKRRAPQPPMGASQSIPNNLSTCHRGGRQRSAENTLRSTKRRAPPPPCANTHQELQDVKEAVDSLNTVEEQSERDESDSLSLSPPSSSSPHPSQPWSSSSPSRPSLAHLHRVADPYLPSLRGKDLSDARCALAKVLTSSFAKGPLVKRLRNSATFPKLYHGSSFVSVTQRSSDKGLFYAESDLTPNLSFEPEWEDPVQRKGVTTFKVVPSKKQKPHDPELTVDVPDQAAVGENPEREAAHDVGGNQTEAEEDPSPPDRSETATPSQSPEPSSQEVQAPERPASPPAPLGSDSPDGPGSPLSEAGDTAEKQQQEEEDEPEATSDAEAPSDGQIDSEEQRESLRSPSGQPVSPHMDHCGSSADETEEDEMIQKEEKEEDSFPPPPPPVFFEEGAEVMEDGSEATSASPLPSSEPPSPTSNGRARSSSEDDHQEPTDSATPDQSAAAPKPLHQTGTPASRFAQAVALAVQRSRIQSHGKGSGPRPPSGPHSTLPSASRSTYQYGA